MPLLRADWSRPWNDLVPVSDASEEGYGVCAAVWDSTQAATIGRVFGREHFRRVESHNAREAALTSAGFIKDEVTGSWASGVLENEEYLRLSGWDLNSDFPKVPSQLVGSRKTVRQGPWRKREHIVHLEAQALVKPMEFSVDDSHARDCRQIFWWMQ